MKLRGRAVLVAVCTAPVLAACTGGADPVGPSTPTDATAPTSAAPEQTTPSDDGAVATTGGPVELALTPATCPEEPVREPQELEASLLVEPGPFAGEAFDLTQVVDAVRAQSPVGPAELAQRHRQRDPRRLPRRCLSQPGLLLRPR